MYLQKAQKHMQRAQQLMLESQLQFGAPQTKFFERNYSQSTKDLIFDHRKGYLVDAINHLLSASEMLDSIDLQLLFPTYSYAHTLKEAREAHSQAYPFDEFSYFWTSLVPGSCISDVVVSILKDDKDIKPWLDKNISPWKNNFISKNEFMSVLTKKMHGVVCTHRKRQSIDNEWNRLFEQHIFPDTSIELELRELLVIAISISSLAMQHVQKKCGHKDLLHKIMRHAQDNSRFFEPLQTNDCLHHENLCKVILRYNLDHMKRIGVPKDETMNHYQPNKEHPPNKIPNIESFPHDTVTVLTSMYNLALTSFNSDSSNDKPFCFPEMYVDCLEKKNQKFREYVKAKQRDTEKHRTSIEKNWGNIKKNSGHCSELIFNVFRAMYFLRFFLRGHEGTPKFKFCYTAKNEHTGMNSYRLSREALVDNKELEFKIPLGFQKKLNNGTYDDVTTAYLVTEPAGRLPEGDLRFDEVPASKHNPIFDELCQSTEEMFEPKKNRKVDAKELKQNLHCPTALRFAEEMNSSDDPLKNNTMIHITKWLLIMGSALHAYGDLEKVKNQSALWSTVKAKIQGNPTKGSKKAYSPGWTCS